MLVLCSVEHQPRMARYRGAIVRPAFNDTIYPRPTEVKAAFSAARRVAAELYRGGRVLVTCSAGLNRSGLVTGLALCMGTKMHPMNIVAAIRRARGEHALSNHAFEKIVLDFGQGKQRHARAQ
jgi:protein-tyrosine phosphatase